MKINAELLIEMRKKNSWSQDELAIASGLNLRTIQRIEKEGSSSLQSKKALASALDVDIHQFDYKEKPTMKRYEYKTIPVKFKAGWLKRDPSSIDELLNKEGSEGWKLIQVIMPEASMGGSEQMVALMEREITEEASTS